MVADNTDTRPRIGPNGPKKFLIRRSSMWPIAKETTAG